MRTAGSVGLTVAAALFACSCSRTRHVTETVQWSGEQKPYEMREGDTRLKNQCRYMVRRPTEIFLKEGEQPPNDFAEGRDELSQEELLKLPVPIPHRPKKDPRELKSLDPACGSGHFLLYCFDLLLTIYEEAYDDPELGPFKLRFRSASIQCMACRQKR